MATLQAYNKKRNFKETSEPSGNSKAAKSGSKLSFVVQRHDATRLHYDFRLQLDGVLKSWAVPKGPSLNPADRRLAVMVEDHPYEYRKFYGTIPEGNYGAGDVEIWDEGLYYPINEDHEPIDEKTAVHNLAKGELKILMAGHHLQGEFVIVRMKPDENNWLLIKHDDDYATHRAYNSEKIESIRSKTERVKTADKKAAAKKDAPKKAEKNEAKAAPKKAEKAASKKAAASSGTKVVKKKSAK